MKFSLALVAAMAASASAFEVKSLTPANYDDITSGKTVFLKFFAPWCGHCKAMASDWEKLAEEWEGNEVGLVAEVDCTDDEAQKLCNAEGVQGFPTLKYGDPTSLEDYQGGRSYDDLAAFAKENLKPVCGLSNIDLCDDEKKAQIEKYQGMSKDDLEKAVEAETAKITDAEELFKTELKKLQDTYEDLMKAKEAKEAEVKAGGLGLMKAVLAKKASGSDEL